MATMMLASPSRRLFQNVTVSRLPISVKAHGPLLQINYGSRTKFTCSRSLTYCGSSRTGNRLLLKPISVVGSGIEASITDPKDNVISIKNVEITVESKDVRVDLSGKETQIVFEKVLRNLAQTAPPVPGFRREKEMICSNRSCGITSVFHVHGGLCREDIKAFFMQRMIQHHQMQVPKDFLLQILGEDRVTNFAIQEIVSTTLGDYAKKENLTVKDNKVNTLQTAEELKSEFVPGNDFGFNATLELDKSAEDSD